MKLKEYAFQFRKDGSLKCIPLPLWKKILERTTPLPNANSQSLTFGEIKLQKLEPGTQTVRFVRLWNIDFNDQGFAEHQEWKMVERPELNTQLGKLFDQHESNTDQMLNDYIESIVNVSPIDSGIKTISDDQEEQFVSRLLAI